MLNSIYRLVAPYRIEVEFSDIDLNAPDQIVVRPTYLSICHADQRYYQGLRSQKIMRDKLPMALIHEGIGIVVLDPTGHFAPGTRVVMIPNSPCEADDVIAENYLTSSRFRGSTLDGFMQEYVALKLDRVIALPDSIPDTVAAFTELISVSMHAINRFERIAHERREYVGIWGDGNLGYITAVLLRYRHPEIRLSVIGMTEQKLSGFAFADETLLAGDLPEGFSVDHAFECCGGNGSEPAIRQIIDHINPEGSIGLLGVSENPVPINTRMVLEKGLRLFGSSRSGRGDFEKTIALYEHNPELADFMMTLISEVVEIHGIDDMKRAFESDMKKHGGKTVMKWI